MWRGSISRIPMSRNSGPAARRTAALARHVSSSAAGSEPTSMEPPVLFETNLALRNYKLNRPKKLNALDGSMIDLLRKEVEVWGQSPLTGTIVGTGVGRGFCAGGDVAAVVQNAKEESTRPEAVKFFKDEFELDYILATLPKPYVVAMDGITMGGGVGLSAHAPFRVATENTVFAMPETKIGYCPDVGASYFLSKMDGEIGTYLALTGETLKARAVYEHGFATHYIPSRRVAILLDRLKALDTPSLETIDRTIEELSSEREPDEETSPLVGDVRVALDSAFRHDSVELILKDLEQFSRSPDSAVGSWATQTLKSLHMRSPTSLKVALRALRKGKNMSLLEVFQMELGIATAYCSGASPDFETGVTAVLISKDKIKSKERPQWSPDTVEEVSPEIVSRFFATKSPYIEQTPTLSVPGNMQRNATDPMRFALPTEEAISRRFRNHDRSTESAIIALPDLLQHFDGLDVLRPGKQGVKEKVLEVVQRRCEFVDQGDGSERYWVRWIV